MNTNTMSNDVTMAGESERALLANRYRIIKQLGQGGMGSVWLAEDTQLDGKLFAIKMLPSILVSNKRAYSQLKAEALVSMKLTHPNIVTLRAFEENNGNPFLVMDYIDGETLDDYLAEKGTLSEGEAIKLLKPVAAALDYAHGEGVVHRDVKPANVMIRKDGHPFVLDFGIAREIQETMTRVTGKLSSGTLLYMSPEQLNGASPKKEQDIYSFAAMAYECLKGNPPFHRGQIEHQILNNLPEPLDIPGALSIANGVMAGLAKNPEERPKTCAAVLAGEGTGSVREESAKRAERPETGRDCVEEEGRGKAHGVGGAIAAMLVAGIFAGGVWFATRNGEPADNPLPPDPPTNVVVNPLPLPPPGPVEADVTEIAVQAKVYKERIGRIDDEDGLKERKDALSDLLAQAFAYSEAKCWDKAAVSFTNYVEGCKKLVALDGKRKVVRERQNAEASRSLAIAASNRAEVAGAKKYAAGSWNDAVAKWKMADVSFDEKRFADARAEFLALKGLFDLCLQETEKAKQTEESAKQRNRTALGKLLDDPSLFPIVRRDLTDAQIGLLSGAYGKVDDARKKSKELLMCYTEYHPEVIAVDRSLKMSIEQFKDLVRKLLEDPAVDSPLIDTTGNTLKAIEAFDAKRYDEAYGLFMKSDLGNKEVQWHLGRMYEYGHGVAKNASEAVKWYRKAAEQGHSGAQNNLGIMYKGGHGVTKDDYEAVKWFRKSAEQGDSMGQCNIGQMYLDGRGVVQNDYEAVQWFRKASEHGNAIGQNRLAFMYASGRGVPRNEAEAVRLYRLSADKFPPSLYALAYMYENGRGVLRDIEEAKKWYRKAAEKGDQNAKKALERLGNDSYVIVRPYIIDGGIKKYVMVDKLRDTLTYTIENRKNDFGGSDIIVRSKKLAIVFLALTYGNRSCRISVNTSGQEVQEVEIK